MRARKLAKVAAGIALAVGAGLGFTRQEANAYGDSAWLWKDLQGKCPAGCDRNVYDCPCRTAAME